MTDDVLNANGVTKLDITLIRGDSKTESLQIFDAATPPVVVNLTAPVVLKASFKEDVEDDNVDAVILKRSYDVAEIEVTDAATGKVSLKLRKADTFDKEPGCYPWDLELTRAGSSIVAALVGTVTVAADSGALVGVGTKFTKLHVGDLLQLTSGDPANAKPVTLTGITDDTHAATDYTGWTAASGLTIAVAAEGDVKTPVGGTLTLKRDVTR